MALVLLVAGAALTVTGSALEWGANVALVVGGVLAILAGVDLARRSAP